VLLVARLAVTITGGWPTTTKPPMKLPIRPEKALTEDGAIAGMEPTSLRKSWHYQTAKPRVLVKMVTDSNPRHQAPLIVPTAAVLPMPTSKAPSLSIPAGGLS
jgi:hypothetical protein